MATALEAGAGQQHTEYTPRIAIAQAESREQQAAQREAGEVGGEHHRERVAARAHELHEQLGPDDLVAERDAAGDGVECEGEACIREEHRLPRSAAPAASAASGG